jgi:Heterokaryon incompatibility protein (HET)
MGATSFKDLDATLTTDEFVYQPLDLDRPTIRVVQIHPGPLGSTVECTLKHIDLEESHVCLSYMCGESEHRAGILVNGKRHSVLPNLFKFLNKARELGITDWLWIDAISIHQTDLQERNLQVRQMATIYRQADHIIVWPGDLHQSDLRVLGKRFESFYSPRWKHFPLIRRAFVPRWNLIYRAIGDLGYFDRVWIIQELLVSKKFLIILGNEFVTEETFREFVRGVFGESGGTWDSTMYQASRLLNVREWTSDSRLRSLTTVLDLASSSRCSEPCDRLFGLLGLFVDGQAFPVDYAKPLAELQLDVVEYFLPAEGLDDNSRLVKALYLVFLLSLAFQTVCAWICKQCSLGAQADSADVSTILEPHREDINAGHILAQANPVCTFTAHLSNAVEGLEPPSNRYWCGIFCRKCREKIISNDHIEKSEIIKLERLSPNEMQLFVTTDTVEEQIQRRRRIRPGNSTRNRASGGGKCQR